MDAKPCRHALSLSGRKRVLVISGDIAIHLLLLHVERSRMILRAVSQQVGKTPGNSLGSNKGKIINHRIAFLLFTPQFQYIRPFCLAPPCKFRRRKVRMRPLIKESCTRSFLVSLLPHEVTQCSGPPSLLAWAMCRNLMYLVLYILAVQSRPRFLGEATKCLSNGLASKSPTRCARAHPFL